MEREIARMPLDPETQAELSRASAQIVIQRIAEQAIANERPLTAEERERLASPRGQHADPFFDGRMVVFLHRIVEREESKSGGLDYELRLRQVLRYAGADRSCALELARYVLCQPRPPFKLQRWFKDKAVLLLCVVIGFVGVFGVFFLLSVLGVLR